MDGANLIFCKEARKKMWNKKISEYDLSTAQEHVKHPKTEFKIGSALDIPYPENYYDKIVSWEVIEHIPKNTEDKMFKEVGRVLKPGISFYLSTPYKQVLSNILDPA